MNKRWLWVILGALVLVFTLILGAVAGGAIVYTILQTRPVQAAVLKPAAVAQDQGVLIAWVEPDSPADKAGLVRGDILLEINGEPMNNPADLSQTLGDLKPKETIEVKVLHGDEQRTLELTLGEQNGRAYLGIVPCPPSRVGVLSLSLAGAQGALIIKVEPDSPADHAGLKVGDVITAVDDQKVTPENDLAEILADYKPNEQVTLSVQSPGEETREIIVTLGENPNQSGKPYLGVRYTLIPHATLKEGETLPFEIPSLPFRHGFRFTWPELPEGVTRGVVISEVAPDSPAEQAGLKPNDVITAIDDEPVKSTRAFINAIQSHKPGDKIALTVYRSGEEEPLTIKVTLGEDPEQASQAYLGVTVSGFFHFQMDKKIPPEVTIPEPFFFEFEEVPCPDCSGGTL